MCLCDSVCVCVYVCVLHASVFPNESARTAAAVSPYKDVCWWKEGWRKREREQDVRDRGRGARN